MSINTNRVVTNRKLFDEGRVGEESFVRSSSDLEGPVSFAIDRSGLPLRFSGIRPQSVQRTVARSVRLVVKRSGDIGIAALGLLTLSPLFALVALAVVLESPGPVFFRQMREGLNGRLFPTYKFRSMRAGECDASGLNFTVASDKRVTRLGAFLRRTSIDELPQLANVLLGHMSMVGPRPHVPGMLAAGGVYRDFVPYYDDRLTMLPGITGWAQANGYRGDVSDPALAQMRIDHDIAYIQNFSLWLDLRIIVTTLRREFIRGSGV
ncbi:sugar transferase [Devosia sp. SL43]|uniref:sugar transferase n=1 Tax=Devosia sp. SL43 TaxID=2806348 RepID=UPI001F158A87|nr:sugar transferase [Devosia sp. SL43]UJW86432.1 sugar transferase [Devosia sp. SL43]